jgi:cold shock CspA family protein
VQGITKKYFEKRGFGFIEDENKNSRFFHISDVNNPTEIGINVRVDFNPKIILLYMTFVLL